MDEFGDLVVEDVGDDLDVPSQQEQERRDFREALFTIVRLIRDPGDRKIAVKTAVRLVEVKYG